MSDELAFLRGKRIFLTGGTGFFGKSLLDFLRRNPVPGLRLVVLSRDPEGFLRGSPEFSALPFLTLTRGDVRNFELEDFSFDAIIHAATTSGGAVSEETTRSVILDGTAHVLKFAEKCRNLQRLLYVSSGAVYGPQSPDCERIGEERECRPVTVYGKSKREAERLVLDSGLNGSIARGFAFVGKYLPRDTHFAAGNFLRDALAGRDIAVNGDGTPLRSYLFADDLAEWLLVILGRGGNSRIYNVGSPDAVSIAELAKTVKTCLNAPGRVIVREKPSGGPPSRYVPSVERAARELGLRVRIPLNEAIRRAADLNLNGIGL